MFIAGTLSQCKVNYLQNAKLIKEKEIKKMNVYFKIFKDGKYVGCDFTNCWEETKASLENMGYTLETY